MSILSGAKKTSAILAITCIFLISSVRVSTTADCGCNDCNSILNRYATVNCVLTVACKERADMWTSGKASTTFDMNDYDNNYKPKWQNAIKNCPRSSSGMGNTDGNCRAKVWGYSNNCVYNSLQKHEGHHVATCESIWKTRSTCVDDGPLSFLKGYADCMIWDEYYRDEIEAYNIELDYLKSQFDSLKASCGDTFQCSKDTLTPSTCPSAVSSGALIQKLVKYILGN